MADHSKKPGILWQLAVPVRFLLWFPKKMLQHKRLVAVAAAVAAFQLIPSPDYRAGRKAEEAAARGEKVKVSPLKQSTEDAAASFNKQAGTFAKDIADPDASSSAVAQAPVVMTKAEAVIRAQSVLNQLQKDIAGTKILGKGRQQNVLAAYDAALKAGKTSGPAIENGEALAREAKTVLFRLDDLTRAATRGSSPVTPGDLKWHGRRLDPKTLSGIAGNAHFVAENTVLAKAMALIARVATGGNGTYVQPVCAEHRTLAGSINGLTAAVKQAAQAGLIKPDKETGQKVDELARQAKGCAENNASGNPYITIRR
ncbi:MAG: hypothetical protein M3O22_05720 [Pseudomonadota bacterium]|nr:hypothetical protein [Pseudomonadota bacterium]